MEKAVAAKMGLLKENGKLRQEALTNWLLGLLSTLLLSCCGVGFTLIYGAFQRVDDTFTRTRAQTKIDLKEQEINRIEREDNLQKTFNFKHSVAMDRISRLEADSAELNRKISEIKAEISEVKSSVDTSRYILEDIRKTLKEKP